ncbi:MAG: type II DNA modification enzyme, partial [Alteraurantiacibacter sp.]|nr:type II DNA modification enzyme [Alteraurantiacibacter sp.]
ALLGVFDLAVLEDGIPDEAYKPLTGDSKEAANHYKARNKAEKKGQGSFDFEAGTGIMPPRKLAANLSTIKAMPENTVGQVEKKREAFEAWRNDPARWNTRIACDLYLAAFLLPKAGLPLNHQRGTVPTSEDVWKKLGGGQIYGPLEAAAVEGAASARALHWPLAFPDIMITRGGFDVVLGNPPWERIKLQEQEFFAGHPVAEEPNAAARTRAITRLAEAPAGSPDRTLYESFQAAKRLAEATSAFVRVGGESGGRYRYTGTGDVNTYALFAELFLNLAREGGRAGLIVPTGIATDATTAPFFGHLVSSQRLAGLIDFENREKLFADVDSRMKFCLLTLGSGVAEASFAFFLTDPAQLEQAERRFTLSPAQIARINPNTRTAPVFRARRDAELTAAIYDRVPVLIEEGKGAAGNPWGVSFMAMFHMSNDSGLFRTAAQLAAEGFVREGTDWVKETGARYVPLYEAKMIHQFDHRWATYDGEDSRDVTLAERQDPAFEPAPRYWVEQAEGQSRLAAKGWKRGWLMGWRDICRATDERTVIAPAFPLSGVGNQLPLMLPDASADVSKLACLIGNLAAISMDFFARHKVGGTHLNFFIYQQFPIPPPA